MLASPVHVDVEQELDELGEFVLAMAQERARAAGIEAEALVRRGDFKSVIHALVKELEIDLVIFGSPINAAGIATFDDLQALADELVSTRSLAVMILRGGEVIYQNPAG